MSYVDVVVFTFLSRIMARPHDDSKRSEELVAIERKPKDQAEVSDKPVVRFMSPCLKPMAV